MDDYLQKMYANNMEPIFKKMKIGDRGIFDNEGREFFIAKHLSKLRMGAYRDRKYILPVEYINNIQAGLDKEAGYQITAGYFGKHFTYTAPALSIAEDEKEKPALSTRITEASNRAEVQTKGNFKTGDIAPER